MIIVMKRYAPREHADHIITELQKQGFEPVPLYGVERTVIAVIGDERKLDIGHLRAMPSVGQVMPVLQPYKLASRESKPEATIIDVKGVKIGGEEIAIMAGPCSVESQEQMDVTARAVSKAGAKILRGGAYKPRTGPYSFEGHKEEGLKMMRKAADANNMIMITEIMDARHIDTVMKYTDILQIGARNMQNFTLLRELSKIRKPVMLKRGLCATMKEFLLAAEYLLSGGNGEVILCERGIRTYEDDMRNTLSIGAVARIKELSHLPLIVDPSHATGIASLVKPASLASIAAGADGLIIEVHPNPEEALSDGDQSITPEEFSDLILKMGPVAAAVGRTVNTN
ncbi:3-deoxy-7-phosphoheptulonate synthase [Candidatus Peregrinibacteria bacterium CG22_combo_CG10-13_8_21_14_all_44_10]|nr:MAG: 3-deoxy-7-phosphoheptulonate synthase [Candidatus Peregrinibacteria bacterium CG2_30_44_17]PIP66370.1 MAG: 3-deoxy-7-phosphoheptulonate synthase [Candidatus Peregrinibacteria bacterium CG22_combo_CG10-13_8_21_14_all_44_10]PIS04146.1 MAG: 3-deoxy-7-phosphoheptulonate synthase [Candidatus Peregrinibacteria bacterium CG10_big_fil_rev_8_21_14_0_10_44_7]PIX79224.1 MAG: 3-deoxy-7-phosphoheptulonate synthase [Candidatus Peregrinibacteria bacterium CG_4_10_14_3_um_filter_44_21]PJB89538.1 MAG: 3